MKKALRHGPIAAAIDGDDYKIMHYKSGIFDDPHNCVNDMKHLNHAVVIVGYTPEYWIVRNSWGKNWGIDGYAYFKMGNTCGIELDAWRITFDGPGRGNK